MKLVVMNQARLAVLGVVGKSLALSVLLGASGGSVVAGPMDRFDLTACTRGNRAGCLYSLYRGDGAVSNALPVFVQTTPFIVPLAPPPEPVVQDMEDVTVALIQPTLPPEDKTTQQPIMIAEVTQAETDEADDGMVTDEVPTIEDSPIVDEPLPSQPDLPTSSVPEPSTGVLLLSGLVALVGIRRRRRVQ